MLGPIFLNKKLKVLDFFTGLKSKVGLCCQEHEADSKSGVVLSGAWSRFNFSSNIDNRVNSFPGF